MHINFCQRAKRLSTPDVEKCNQITVRQAFSIQGPRLTKTAQHKKNVMYDTDKRLEIKGIMKMIYKNVILTPTSGIVEFRWNDFKSLKLSPSIN